MKAIAILLFSLWMAEAHGVPEHTAEPRTAEQWSSVILDIEGPLASEDGEINPFRDFRLTATFTHDESGHSVEVPGYFAADGRASDSHATEGRVWRVHFVPERPGRWRYRISLRRGLNIAIQNDPNAGEPTEGDGIQGTLDVAPNPTARGILKYRGDRYLRYAGTGEPFLKGGVDSPENLLAYADFDGTATLRSRPRAGEAHAPELHQYAPHVQDWKTGDPTWSDGQGKGLIGALNYLAAEGLNSIYFVTMNLRGDGRDVWPYADAEVLDRFDVSKFAQWEMVFEHADRTGLLLHFVLTETENEAFFEHEDDSDSDFSDLRKLYYRELVARFGHHSALVWNVGEENGGNDGPRDNPNPYGLANTTDQRKAFANYLRDLDPYDHPIVVHTFPGQYDKIYTPLLGFEALEGPSLQISDMKRTHEETLKWVRRSREAGRPWFVCLDEIGPPDTGVKPDSVDPDHAEPRRYALWGNLMAGGSGVEWYLGYQYPNNDLTCEDFRPRAQLWGQTRNAIRFFHRELPFPDMEPADDLARGIEGAFVMAHPGDCYAVYLPSARETVELELAPGAYRIEWFDPRHGGELQRGSIPEVRGSGWTELGTPPGDREKDWVVVVRRLQG